MHIRSLVDPLSLTQPPASPSPQVINDRITKLGATRTDDCQVPRRKRAEQSITVFSAHERLVTIHERVDCGSKRYFPQDESGGVPNLTISRLPLTWKSAQISLYLFNKAEIFPIPSMSITWYSVWGIACMCVCCAIRCCQTFPCAWGPTCGKGPGSGFGGE